MQGGRPWLNALLNPSQSSFAGTPIGDGDRSQGGSHIEVDSWSDSAGHSSEQSGQSALSGPAAPRPQDKASASQKAPLLFVNSVNSLPIRSSGQSRKAINAHVQRNQHRKRRLENARRFQQSSDNITIVVPRGPSDEEVHANIVIRRVSGRKRTPSVESSQKIISVRDSSSRSITPKVSLVSEEHSLSRATCHRCGTRLGYVTEGLEPEYGHDDDGEIRDIRRAVTQALNLLDQHSCSRSGVNSVSSFLDKADFEPFATSAIPLSKQYSVILHHFCEVFSSAIFSTRARRDLHVRFAMSLALEHPRVLYGILALSAADLETRRGQFTFKPKARRALESGDPVNTSQDLRNLPDFVKYKLKAIEHLNAQFTNPEQAAQVCTVFGIIQLLAVELMAGNENEIAVHLNGLQKIMAMRNGSFAGFPSHVVEVMLQGFYMCSTITQSMPPIPPPPDYHTVSEATISLIASTTKDDLRNMGAFLYRSDHVALFDWRLLYACNDLRDVTIFRESYGANCSGFESTDLAYFNHKAFRVNHTLLSFPFEHRLHKTTSDKQEAFRTGLLIFCHTQYRNVGPSSVLMRNLTMQLKEALDRSELQSFWNPACELLMWVLFLGAHICGGQKERPWFVMMLARGARLLELREWRDVRETLAQCFYVERIYGEPYQEIWEEVKLLIDDAGALMW